MQKSIQNEIIKIIGDISSTLLKEELERSISYEWDNIQQSKTISNIILTETLEKLLLANKRTKHRWASKEEEKGSSYEKEMNKASKVWIGENGFERFKKEYGNEEFHTYKVRILDEIKEWAKNEDALCVHFRYFEDKMRWQKLAAIRSDIKILCLRKILEKCEDVQKPVVSQLNSWAVAIDYTARGSFPETNTDEEMKKVSTLTINLPGGTSIRQELTIEETKSDLYSSKLVQKLMNGWDLSLLRFVLHKLAEQQYRDKDIVTTRKEILDFIKQPLSGKNYELVEVSIKKLIALTIFINSPTNNFSLRFLENYYLSNKGKQETLSITLNKDVYTQALNGKITSMYKDVIDSLSNAATAMIYRLQRLRIHSHYQGESPIVRLDLNFFKTILIFNSQRKDRMCKTIEDTLDEIISMGVTLKRYDKVSDSVYELEFLPLSESEMYDLGTSNTNTEQLVFPLMQEYIEKGSGSLS